MPFVMRPGHPLQGWPRAREFMRTALHLSDIGIIGNAVNRGLHVAVTRDSIDCVRRYKSYYRQNLRAAVQLSGTRKLAHL